MKEGIRAQVIADFGLDSENLSEQDELTVDAVVEDRIMATKKDTDRIIRFRSVFLPAHTNCTNVPGNGKIRMYDKERERIHMKD